GNLVQVNDKVCAIFGYGKRELEGMTVNDLTVPEDVAFCPRSRRTGWSWNRPPSAWSRSWTTSLP
ncbi:MAG TPA: PAS domain S-box protein, partial [Desulfobacterales bacterium]|nr:PAS domain S-box protein [Desulfobacterales bacterium]